MTKRYAEIAKKYNRKVWAIDPWYEKNDNVKYDENLKGFYEEFKETVKEYSEYVNVIRENSTTPETIEKIKSINICFASVDGLHTKEACYSDIMATSHCKGVIAVDDVINSRGFVTWEQQMRDAISLAMEELKESFEVVWPTKENKIEKNAYIYRK